MALLQKAYLGATPLFRNTSWFEDDDYTVLNQSSNVTVTANSSAHTKGAWAELISSSSANASLLYVRVTGVSASATETSTLLDIGVGASGSESAILSNVAVGGAASAGNTGVFYFFVPIQIASGSRVSARIQSVVTGGKTAEILVRLIDTGDYATAPTSVDVIGADTATSRGTTFASANTYVQLTSATSRAYRALVLIPSLAGAGITLGLFNYTVAKGASGSETELQTATSAISNAEFITTADNLLIVSPIASGTRLAVKVSTGMSNPAQYASCLIGIP